jgi:hypothetical protein
MTKPIELSRSQWNTLLVKLKEDYPASVLLLRERTKARLGFVPREYKDWDVEMGKYGGWRKNCIMLDFYSEKKRTWFIMKYGEYLHDRTSDDF